MHILVIEDNVELSTNLWEYLESKGNTMDAAADGVTGLHLATVNDYDVIVLDLTLPGMDGREVCSKLRNDVGKSTPVLMLTARDTLDDKLSGFCCGADDYLVKPFALEELEVRLEAVTRRAKVGCPGRVLRVADLSMDLDTLQVTRSGQSVTLTPTARKILEVLMRQSERVVLRRDLERALWGDSPPDSDALRAHVHCLRNAIDKPFKVPLLHTVHGVGYRLSGSYAVET